jgi:methyl-accepting chemotaxis protein
MNKLGIRARFAIIAIVTVLLSVGIATGAIIFIMKNDMERQAKQFQDAKLRMFHQVLEVKGKAKLADGNIVFGDYVANNNFEVVDKLKEIAGGTATIFMGDTRVATNVLKEDGSRAVGTTLQGVARDTVLGKGVGYRGEADILGVPYFTAYDPVLDAKGNAIGILYVGLKKDEFLASLHTSYYVAGGVAAGLTVLFVGLILLSVGGMLKEIIRLTKAAEDISVGAALEEPIKSERGDELRLLAVSIERLRKSMKTALERLG